jgi:hypothetical protein
VPTAIDVAKLGHCAKSSVVHAIDNAMSKSKELWRGLRVGDRVRLVEIPAEFLQEGCFVHRETLRVYKRLIARKRALRVFQIDQWKLPWIQCRFRRKDGRWEHHWLAINHSGLRKVQSRR